MIRKRSSVGVGLLSLLYLLLAGQVAVCSHEQSIHQESDRGSGESDQPELFCGGDCQNISSAAIVSAPTASSYFPLLIGLAFVAGILFRLAQLLMVSSRAPPLAGLS